MGKHEKNRDENGTIKKIVFITAIMNLIKAIADLIRTLTG